MKLVLAAVLALSVSPALARQGPSYQGQVRLTQRAVFLPADPQADILRETPPNFTNDHRVFARLRDGEAVVDVGYHRSAHGEVGGKFIAAWKARSDGEWGLAAYADNPAINSLHEQAGTAREASIAAQRTKSPDPSALDDVYVRMRQAYRDLDGAMLSRVYAADGWYVSRGPKAPVESAQGAFVPGVGRFMELSRSNGTTMDLAFRLTDRQMLSPNVVVDTGYVEFVMTPGDGKPERRSTAKFLTVLTREADGRWVFWADTASDTPKESWSRGAGRPIA